MRVLRTKKNIGIQTNLLSYEYQNQINYNPNTAKVVKQNDEILIQFLDLNLQHYNVLNKAILRLKIVTGDTNIIYNVYEVNEGYIPINTKYSNKPNTSLDVVTYLTRNLDDEQKIEVDLTDLLVKWKKEQSGLHAISIKPFSINGEPFDNTIDFKFIYDNQESFELGYFEFQDVHTSQISKAYSTQYGGQSIVNLYTGKSSYQFQGIQTNSVKTSFTFGMNWILRSNVIASGDGQESLFGQWRTSFDYALRWTGTDIILGRPDGSTVIYEKYNQAAAKDKFSIISSQELVYIEPTGTSYIEHLSGVFKLFDRVGNCTELYLGGMIKRIISSTGDELVANNNGTRITSFTSPEIQVTLIYDIYHRLTGVYFINEARRHIIYYNTNGVSHITTERIYTVVIYDSQGNPSTITQYELLFTTFFDYTGTPAVLSKFYDTKTKNGYLMTYTNNKVSKVTSIIQESTMQEGSYIEFEYLADYILVTDSLANSNRIYYNKSGQQVQIFDNHNRLIMNQYQTNNNIITLPRIQSRQFVNQCVYPIISEKNFDFKLNELATLYGWHSASLIGLKIVNEGIINEHSLWINNTSSGGNKEIRQRLKFPNVANTYTARMFIKTKDISGNAYALIQIMYLVGGSMQFALFQSPFFGDTNNKWKEISWSFTIPTDIVEAIVDIHGKHTAGELWVDSFHLNEINNRNNIIKNGNFVFLTNGNLPSFWTTTDLHSTDIVNNNNTSFFKDFMPKEFRFTSTTTVTKKLYQNIDIEGHAGDNYNFGVWLRSNGFLSPHNTISIKFLLDEDIVDSYQLPITMNFNKWQYSTLNFGVKSAYDSIKIELDFRNTSNLYIGAVELFKESNYIEHYFNEIGQIGSNSGQSATNLLVYDENNVLVEQVLSSGNAIKYNYDSEKKPVDTKDSLGNEIVNQYAFNDNLTKISKTLMINEAPAFFESEFTYSGNYIQNETDEFKQSTNYTYNDQKLISTVTNPISNIEQLLYNHYRLQTQKSKKNSSGSLTSTIQYSYDAKLRLQTVTISGLNYNFVYDSWDRVLEVRMQSESIIGYTYKEGLNQTPSDMLVEIKFGNNTNEKFIFSYDAQNRLKTIHYNLALLVTYDYDAFGNTYRTLTEGFAESFFEYDAKMRVVRETEYPQYGVTKKIIDLEYDNSNKVQKQNVQIVDRIRSYDFDYSEEFSAYSYISLKMKISTLFDADIMRESNVNGYYGMKGISNNVEIQDDDLVSYQVPYFNKTTSFLHYDLDTVNEKRVSNSRGSFNRNLWKSNFSKQKSFFGWFKFESVGPTDSVVLQLRDASNEKINVYIKSLNTTNVFIFTLKNMENNTSYFISTPATSNWIFIGLSLNRDQNNNLIYLLNVNNTNNSIVSTHTLEIDKLKYLSVFRFDAPESEPTYPASFKMKTTLLSITDFRFKSSSFGYLYEQGRKYINQLYMLKPQSGVTYMDSSNLSGVEYATLNGSFMTNLGNKPIQSSINNLAYSLVKNQMFEYDTDLKRFVYGSYKNIAFTEQPKAILSYEFDNTTSSTFSIRFKPILEDSNRTILMIKALDKRLGIKLNNSSQIVLVYNSTEEIISETIPLNIWNTLVISFTNQIFRLFLPHLSAPITRGSLSINLSDARIYVGSDFEDGVPTNHFNGNLESLMYKTGYITNQSSANIYFNQKHVSSRTILDGIGRVEKEEISTGTQVLTTNYTYSMVLDAPGSTKRHLEVTTSKPGTTNNYVFNGIGNLTKKTFGSNVYEYSYDYLNRLTEEKLNTTRFIKTLYSGNNISSKEVYSNNGQTLDYTLQYTYDTTWKERLIKVAKIVSGTEVEALNISYSGSNYIGNPSIYDGNSLTWQGRRLLQVGPNTTYAYNDQGLRVKKVNSTGTTYYHLSGSRIAAESKEGYTIFYHYNEKGSIIGFDYDGNQYFYNKDLTGVITDVLDSNGNIMVSYEYDAWGKVTNRVIINATVNSKNNFLYKGYYYDVETGWYYLNSRYYDPNTARFINADNVSYLDMDSVENVSLFGYCNNNPVMYTDRDGNNPEWGWVFWGLAGLIVVGLGIATIVSAGGVLMGLSAIAFAANGVVLGSTTTAVLSFAFVGAATALSGALLLAAVGATDWDAFANRGLGAFGATAIGGAFGAIGGYISYKEQIGEPQNWNNIRTDYWKSKGRLDGSAKPGNDGHPMVLHHPYGRFGSKVGIFEPMTRTEHIQFHRQYGYGQSQGGYNQPYDFYNWWEIFRRL